MIVIVNKIYLICFNHKLISLKLSFLKILIYIFPKKIFIYIIRVLGNGFKKYVLVKLKNIEESLIIISIFNDFMFYGSLKILLSNFLIKIEHMMIALKDEKAISFTKIKLC